MKQFLISFTHDSKRLGYDGTGQLLVSADSVEEAGYKIADFSVEMTNSATGYKWYEYFEKPRDFINLTI